MSKNFLNSYSYAYSAAPKSTKFRKSLFRICVFLKALPLTLFLLGAAQGAEAVSTKPCTAGQFCVSEQNFKDSKSVYTSSDHQNAQLNIHNPHSTNDATTNMFLQVYGKDTDNRINANGNITSVNMGIKSKLSVDMKNANYTGNIKFEEDKAGKYDYVNQDQILFSIVNTTINGNIDLVHYKTNEGQGIVFTNSTLNGHLYVKPINGLPFIFTNSTFNGDISFLYDYNDSLTGQNFIFNNNTFNNSKITLGYNPKLDIDPDLYSRAYIYTIINNDIFNNVNLNFAFPVSTATFKNNQYNNGTITINNKAANSTRPGNTNGLFDSQGSRIKANITINGDGTQVLSAWDGKSYYTSASEDPDPKYDKKEQPLYSDQKLVPCKSGGGYCYSAHDPKNTSATPLYSSTKKVDPKTGKDVIGKDGKPVYIQAQGLVETYTPGKKYTNTINKLGMDFIFQGLAATDTDNASGVYQTSSFEGNISLAGGSNNFTIKDKTTMKNGTLSISGGNNTFNITDGSSFDGFNIEISRLLKDKSQINPDDLPNWKNCTNPDSLCYQDPSNTFTIDGSSFKNSSFLIIGGESNIFNFTNSSFSDGNITILGGDKNTLNFKDSPKIGGNILISGGSENNLSFSNTTLSDTAKKLIAPSSAALFSASAINPFDKATMTPIKAAIITGQMTPDFIKSLNEIAPDLFGGNLTLGSSSISDTNNSIVFSNGIIQGDVLIQNGNAQNIKQVLSNISMQNNLFLGDIKSSGKGMTTQNTLKNSAMIGDIQTLDGINYTILDNSQLYGDITTQGGTNITQIKNGSVFAGSMDTYNGKNFVDLNMSLYTNQNNEISKINTYGGESNITLSINSTIAAVLTSQKIYPVFHIGNYNGGIANIAVEGPVSGTAQVDYSGGTANIIFADGFDSSVTNAFFANGTACASSISPECIASGQATIDPTKGVFKINGYTYQDGLAIKLDAQKADKILKPFRDVYNQNYASIFLDKSGIAADGTKDGIYRMRIEGVIVGAEYNLPSSSNKKYEVTFGRNSAFIGQMFAKTDNTNFILSQGSKLVLDGGSNSVISKLSSQEMFSADTDTMFDATLAQKNNVIIDLATSGEQVTRAFKKDTFSTMHIQEIDNFNNAVFRVGIDASKTDATMNINSIPSNTDRVIISNVVTGQHLSNYLQVYQDYNHLITGDLSQKNILVAIVENQPKPNTSMVFDTSASKVQQGYDQVNTILTTKPVKVDKTGTGAIDINPNATDANAIGYFIQSAATQVDPKSLANTNNAITSNYAIFLANINNLNKRMGELRDNSYAQGAWSRVFSGLNSSTRGDESKIYSNNIQFGYDYGWNTDVGEQFLGGAFTYGYDSIKGNAYNGSANVLEFAGYYSWVGNEGLYTDTILKYTYIRNRISLKDNVNYNVPLNSNGGSIGQELGYRYYANKDKSFYIEPSAEVILGVMNGGVINQVSQSGLIENGDFTATLQADLNYVFNFRGKVGANFGYRLKTDKNQTDFRIGAFYVADVVNGGVISYKTNYSSAQTLLQPNQQMMINLGVNSIVSENWRVYADVDTGFLGAYFNQNYLVSVGLRYEFGHALNPLAARLAQEKRIKNIKLYTQRLDEGIARVKLKQDRIRQSEIFEKQKADILATSEAKQAANIAIRKKERDLDGTKFKTLTLAIAKVINEALPDTELEKFQAQETKVLEDAKTRVTNNIQNDTELNRKEILTQHTKEQKELETRQPQQQKDLEDKQAQNKKDMLEKQADVKKIYTEKQIKAKEAFIAKQAQELEKATPQEKSKLQDKQSQELKDFEHRQTQDMKVFDERMAKDVKDLENKQAKALAELKNKQAKEAKDLKIKQDKENKVVEEFIAKQQKESSKYLKQISDDLSIRQTKAKKALEEAQKNALLLQIKKAIDNRVSDDELQKLHDKQNKELKAHQVAMTQELENTAELKTNELKDKQAQELEEFAKKQSAQSEDLLQKQSKAKEELQTKQKEELKKSKDQDKSKLQAKQKKEVEDFEATSQKQSKALKESQAKDKKALEDKQAKERKDLQTSLAKQKKENEEHYKKAFLTLQTAQTKDKKALEEVRKIPKKAQKVEKSQKSEKAGKVEKVQKAEKVEKAEKIETAPQISEPKPNKKPRK